MKVLGYLTPIVYMAFGVVSESVLGITEPVWYGSGGYLMGFFAAVFILWEE